MAAVTRFLIVIPSLFLFLVLSSRTAEAYTALPLNVTVQTGDTLHFTPVIKGWNSSETGGSAVALTQPKNGTLQIIPSYFDSTNRLFPYPRQAECPKNYPGFRYIPNASFLGRDTFTFRIRTAADSSAVTTCVIRVTPAEPGGMTVLMVVNQLLQPSISAELDTLKADLEREGYAARIVPFPDMAIKDSVNAKKLWDTLSAHYNNPSQTVAGALLIGKIPWYPFTYLLNYGTSVYGPQLLTKESAFWCMSFWEGETDADSTVAGIKVSRVANQSAMWRWYTPGYLNIWVSRFNATSNTGAAFTTGATELQLLKRMFAANHAYRAGKSRLPQAARQYLSLGLEYRNCDINRYKSVWTDATVRYSTNSSNPFDLEFKTGGELWDISIDGDAGYYSAGAGWSIGGSPSYHGAGLLETHVPFRVFLSNSCHTGGLGTIVNSHLYPKNGGCVLAVGPTDYCMCRPQYAFDDTSRQTKRRMSAVMAAGERWGRAVIRSNACVWSTVFHGDLSLRPKMAPANQKPVINRVTPVKTGALSWTFTVSASDPDDAVTAYDWYANGYRKGLADPDSSTPRNTFSYTYATAKICTLRVEVTDGYMARDYAMVILKTDTGVLKIVQPGTRLETSPAPIVSTDSLRADPNPFNPSTVISYRLDRLLSVRLDVYTIRGEHVARLVDGKRAAGAHSVEFNGKSLGNGMFIAELSAGGTVRTARLILLK